MKLIIKSLDQGFKIFKICMCMCIYTFSLETSDGEQNSKSLKANPMTLITQLKSLDTCAILHLKLKIHLKN